MQKPIPSVTSEEKTEPIVAPPAAAAAPPKPPFAWPPPEEDLDDWQVFKFNETQATVVTPATAPTVPIAAPALVPASSATLATQPISQAPAPVPAAAPVPQHTATIVRMPLNASRRAAAAAAALVAVADESPPEPAAAVAPASAPANTSWGWMPWVLIAVLLLIAVGEAAYIATPLLRARGLFGRPAVARLVVQAQSNGVDVTIDGQRRGQTPLNIELTPGPHVLELRANESERTPAPAPAPAPAPVAAVPPPTPAPVVPAVQTPPPAPSIGWLVVQSPLTLSVLRNGELIGNSDEGRLKLAPGHHEVELSNSAAGYREATTIQVIAGRETVLHPDLPQSTIDIQATPSAKIFIDGREVGDTPLLQLALTIGSHDILFRHPDFGDRHVTTFIRVGTPARASVDFSTQ